MHLRNKQPTDQDQESEQSDEAAPLISEPARSQSSRARPLNDPRFNPPPPSPYKRLALVLGLVFLFWAGFKLRAALLLSKKPQVIHASRYSKEFKFRPAASPIITETLKDGRIRLRGALPEPTVDPLPTTPPKKKKKKRKKTGGSGKRKHGKPKAKRAQK